jgi:hypothetical protein
MVNTGHTQLHTILGRRSGTLFFEYSRNLFLLPCHIDVVPTKLLLLCDDALGNRLSDLLAALRFLIGAQGRSQSRFVSRHAFGRDERAMTSALAAAFKLQRELKQQAQRGETKDSLALQRPNHRHIAGNLIT